MDELLIIEDEEMLRSSMVRGLSKLPSVNVREARDLEQAVRLIDELAPTIIVSDIDLPGRSGIELLGELGRRALRVPVLFVSGFLKAYRSQIPQHADVEVMEKPVSLEELRVVITRRLSQSRSSQEVAPFSLPDYLQLACMGKHSVNVSVHRQERELGRVQVWQGAVYFCTDLLGQGEDAFKRLAFTENTTVQCATLAKEPPTNNINANWEFLLMEAARLKDEGRTEDAYAQVPISSARVPSDSSQAKEAPSSSESLEQRLFARAWDEGVEALLSKDYPAALSAFLRADQICPGESKVLANIGRLQTMGIVAVTNPPPPAQVTQESTARAPASLEPTPSLSEENHS